MNIRKNFTKIFTFLLYVISSYSLYAAQEAFTLNVICVPQDYHMIEIEARPSETISQLQEKIAKAIDFDPTSQSLTFKEQPLDPEEAIATYGIKDEDTLFIREWAKEFVPFKCANGKSQKEINFSNEAPDWRVLARGLNFEGLCKNQKCVANGEKVWIQKHFGTFCIAEEIWNSTCPICKTQVEDITEYGFFYCKYEIKGLTVDNEKIEIKDSHNRREGFRKFLADRKGSSNFRYLKMIVTPHEAPYIG